MGIFERYLSVWVALCIAAGVVLGNLMPGVFQAIAAIEYGQINLVVALLIWLMIYPMMVQIDFSSIKNVRKNLKGLGLTVVINWLIKPFTMSIFAYIFFNHIFSAWIHPEDAEQYLAGAILLGVAPCTAMVFVWSYLTRGDANYTLVQVSVNDLILLILFIPIVGILFHFFGINFTDNQTGAELGIPYDALFTSVFVFVVIPLLAGYVSNKYLIKRKGLEWFHQVFLKKLKPISIIALLSTLVLLFAFQGDKIVQQPFNIVLIAIPLTIQTYFIFFVSWFIGKYLKLPHNICAPAAMIGASNFFELAVAVAIALFGLNSGASLATVVGVLIEVPVMLSLVALANKWKY